MRVRSALAWLLPALACAPEQAFPVDPGESVVYAAGDARIVETWTTSTAATALEPVDDALCFLSGVMGRFDKPSDEASVRPHEGRWVLTASSRRSCRFEHPIGAAATCVPRPSRVSAGVAPRVVNEGGASRSLAIEGDAALSGLFGKWRGSGEGAWIGDGALVVSNAHAHEPFVAAEAMALGLPSGSLGAEVVAEANAGPVDLGDAATHICLLTRVEGDFWVATDGVRLAVKDGRWTLETRSGSHEGAGVLDRPLRAGARCFAR